MRRGRRTMLLLGGVLAIIAFFVLYLGLSGGGGGGQRVPPTATPEPVMKVVAAAKDIPSFTVVKAEDITIKEVRVSEVISGSIAGPAPGADPDTGKVIGQVLGRAYIADSQILEEDVLPPGISQALQKNERAFTIAVQEINNFGGQVFDNDTVDVLWTRTFEVTTNLVGPDGKTIQVVKPLPTTRKLLDNIKILRVIPLRQGGNARKKNTGPVNATPQQGQNVDPEVARLEALQGLYDPKAPPSAAFILALTDQQAEVVKFAREQGILDLTLRAKDDTDVERTTGITDKILIEDYGMPEPELIIK